MDQATDSHGIGLGSGALRGAIYSRTLWMHRITKSPSDCESSIKSQRSIGWKTHRSGSMS
jgi:hypothetical protein